MINFNKFKKKILPLHNPFNLKPNFSKLKGKKLPWKKIKFWGLRVFIAFLAFVVFLFAWFAKDLPTPGKIKSRRSAAATQLFDRNGKPIYVFHGEEKRILVESKDIPDIMKKATITAEDRGFYRHHGIQLTGIMRAAWQDITRQKSYISGGSTITQQYVKNALLDPRKTLTRKMKELILSLEIEAMYSKDEILTMYLNEIPYGSNAYGIQAAANTYFDKDAKDLTLPEAATIAALTKAPTYYSPYGVHPDKREARVNYILDSMADLGHISKEEAEKAKVDAKNLKYAEPKEYITAPHFAMYVKELLVDKYGEQMVNEGGLKVTTSLDLDKQSKAEEAIKAGADKRFDGINASNAALVSLDPKTGQILAMVGSIDFFKKDIDGQVNVADSLRQPGSAFKPIVYATAFKGKYNPGYTLWDVTTDFGNYTPKNYDGNTHGPVSMRTALAGSLNIPAVKTLYLAGIDNSIRTAHDMGITSLNDRNRYGLSLVLGGGEVKLVDLTTAYGVFANQGKLSPTSAIIKVEDANGKVLEEYKDGEGRKEVLDPQIAYEISSILSDNDARSYVFGSRSALYFGDRPVAVKTGTTSEYRDAWTVGYTPSIVTGVWVGNNDNSRMSAGAAGAMAAAPIWHQYMASVLDNTPNEDFARPEGIQEVTVDKLSNKLPTQHSPETIKDLFASWQVPTDKDDIHVSLRLDKFTGKQATDECPDAYTESRTFTNLHSEVPDNQSWESPVRAAAEAFGINISYPPQEKSCVGLAGKPGVEITSPRNGSNVESSFTIKVDAQSSAAVTSVDFQIDGVNIGTDSDAPYSMDSPGLSKGKHSITVIAHSINGSTATDKITVNVNKDNSGPDGVTINELEGTADGFMVSWTNPSNSDVDVVRIYVSPNKGQIGTVLRTVDASPSSSSSTTIDGLTSNKTYWVTIKAVDQSGNESSNNTQNSVKAK